MDAPGGPKLEENKFEEKMVDGGKKVERGFPDAKERRERKRERLAELFSADGELAELVRQTALGGTRHYIVPPALTLVKDDIERELRKRGFHTNKLYLYWQDKCTEDKPQLSHICKELPSPWIYRKRTCRCPHRWALEIKLQPPSCTPCVIS